MGKLSTYLNFNGRTEEAFTFYKKVFNGKYGGDGISRFKDMPKGPESENMPEEVLNQVMHVELIVMGDQSIMGSDAPHQMGFTLELGNNYHISVNPDSLEEATTYFNGLAEGGEIKMPLQKTFWGATFGMVTDQFGIQWMFNVE